MGMQIDNILHMYCVLGFYNMTTCCTCTCALGFYDTTTCCTGSVHLTVLLSGQDSIKPQQRMSHDRPCRAVTLWTWQQQLDECKCRGRPR